MALFSLFGVFALFLYFSISLAISLDPAFHLSTGERPFVDLIQDRRFWLIHAITIPTLFLSGTILVASGFVYKLFGSPNLNQYFAKDLNQIPLINDRYSVLYEISEC